MITTIDGVIGMLSRRCSEPIGSTPLNPNYHTMVKLVELMESNFSNEANMFNIRVGVVGWEHPSYGI